MPIAGSFSTKTGQQWTSSPAASTALPGVDKAYANVLPIISWDKERSEPEYRQGLRKEAWEVVVPSRCLHRRLDAIHRYQIGEAVVVQRRAEPPHRWLRDTPVHQ